MTPPIAHYRARKHKRTSLTPRGVAQPSGILILWVMSSCKVLKTVREKYNYVVHVVRDVDPNLAQMCLQFITTIHAYSHPKRLAVETHSCTTSASLNCSRTLSICITKVQHMHIKCLKGLKVRYGLSEMHDFQLKITGCICHYQILSVVIRYPAREREC